MQLGESSPPFPHRRVSSRSRPRGAPLGHSCEPEFGCGNRATSSRALPQTKARPLSGPVKAPASPASHPSLFPGSAISPGASRPAALVPQGLPKPSGPGTRGPRRQNGLRADMCGGPVSGVGNWVAAGPCVLRLWGQRGNCACGCGMVSVTHGILDTGDVGAGAL